MNVNARLLRTAAQRMERLVTQAEAAHAALPAAALPRGPQATKLLRTASATADSVADSLAFSFNNASLAAFHLRNEMAGMLRSGGTRANKAALADAIAGARVHLDYLQQLNAGFEKASSAQPGGWSRDLVEIATIFESDDPRIARLLIERAAAGTTTPEHARAELAAIVARPNSKITNDHVLTLAALEVLPEAMGPFPTEFGIRTSFGNLLRRGSKVDRRDIAADIDYVRALIERDELMAQGAPTREDVRAELFTLLAKPDAALSRSHLKRLAVLTSLPEQLTDLPMVVSQRGYARAPLGGVTGYASKDRAIEMANLRMWAEHQQRQDSWTAERAVSRLEQLLAKKSPTVKDLRQLIEITELPKGTRPPLHHMGDSTPRRIALTPDAGIGLRRKMQGAIAHRYELGKALAEPGRTATTTRDEIAAILRRPSSDLSRADIERLAVLRELPVARGPLRTAIHQTLDLTGYMGQDLEELRAHSTIQRMRSVVIANDLVDAGITRESATAQLLAILDKGNNQITAADRDTVAALESLPTALRPSGLDAHLSEVFDDWDPTDQRTRGLLLNLRSRVHTQQLLSDPTLTPERALDELLMLITKPANKLSDADYGRAHALATLPEPLAPRLNVETNDDEPIADFIKRLAEDGPGKWDKPLLDDLRFLHKLTHNPAEQTTILRQIERGKLHPVATALLAEMDPSRLQAAGITAERRIMRLLDDAARPDEETFSAAAAADELSAARLLLRARPVSSDVEQQLVSSTDALISANIERVTGHLSDGFDGYPNYSDLGRARANVELLLKQRTQTPPTSTATTTSTLSW